MDNVCAVESDKAHVCASALRCCVFIATRLEAIVIRLKAIAIRF